MDPKGQSLLKLLFNEGETICVSNNEFGYHSIPLENALNGEVELLSPSDKTKYVSSSDLTMVAINPINGYRRDEKVTAFRSFLWEIDTGSIKEQAGYLKHLEVPLSAQIFSGNKSIHAVTVLDEDLSDEKRWRYLCLWGLNILKMCDDNCKNPSRSTRIPGAYRESGKKQRLININRRISHKEFFDWLNQYPQCQPRVRKRKAALPGQANYDLLSAWARGMLTKGLEFKNGRNQTWFALAVDFAKAGYSEEQAIEELSKHFSEEHDFKEKEWLTTVGSGFKYVSEGKS